MCRPTLPSTSLLQPSRPSLLLLLPLLLPLLLLLLLPLPLLLLLPLPPVKLLLPLPLALLLVLPPPEPEPATAPASCIRRVGKAGNAGSELGTARVDDRKVQAATVTADASPRYTAPPRVAWLSAKCCRQEGGTGMGVGVRGRVVGWDGAIGSSSRQHKASANMPT